MTSPTPSPEQRARAEKILRDNWYGWADTVLRGDAPECVNRIAASIREAVEQASEELEDTACCHEDPERNCSCKVKSRRESLEEAAKVLRELGLKFVPEKTMNDAVWNGAKRDAFIQAEYAIRSLIAKQAGK